MLDKCSRCSRVYSTDARDTAPADPGRCPECRLLPQPAAAESDAEAVPAMGMGWHPGLVVALLAAGAAAVGLGAWQFRYPGRSFDPGLWRDESRMADGVRHD